MAKELEAMWSKLSFTEEEDVGIELGSNNTRAAKEIFNLPLISRTKETGWEIGSSLGDVMEVDVLDLGVHWGKSLRVRVRIDATKNSSVAKELPLKEVSPGGSSSSMNDSPIFATIVDC
ncbi:hypothetical protein CFP56_020875 [Quercus suber]|uniref:Uncharacterized protein n=1 Tax=Quercus suber TaxID=58331 RepID=A0AAW0KGP1_QUESU